MAHQAITLAAQHLISRAQHSGFVVTITTQPGTPLAMGNYRMQVDVRQARNAPPCENITFNGPALWPGDLESMQDAHHALGNALQALLAINPTDARVAVWAERFERFSTLCTRLSTCSQPYHSTALRSIIIERCREMGKIDWTPEAEDGLVNEELAAMASYYAMPEAARDWPAQETGYGDTLGQAIRPEGWEPYPASRRGQLVKAAAMALAEIERYDRQAQPGQVAEYPELTEAAPLAYSGDGACAYVCFAANGNCISWSTNQQQVADAAAKYGRPYIPLYGPKAGEVSSVAASDVLAERARQITECGHDHAHDDSHADGQIADEAARYLMSGQNPQEFHWAWKHKHPCSPKRVSRRMQLVIGVALGLAEIERMDRATAKGGT